ncbi:hypothetical protein L7F22_027021 [Adiantum nelumboides]|nr:hypothetical protein [Adiantum nelumboides]
MIVWAYLTEEISSIVAMAENYMACKLLAIGQTDSFVLPILQIWGFLLRRRCTSWKMHMRGKDYTKVLLPTRFPTGVLSLPAISVPVKQDPMSTTLDHMNLAANEVLGWFAQMGNRYGTSLLCLLVLGYWVQGFRCFPWMAMCFYLKDGLQVDPGTLQFCICTVNLPVVAKPIYGIISDVIYIGGDRRMPYLMFAGKLDMFMLSWSTNAIHFGIRSAITPLMGVLLVSNVGAAVAEVVNDALVAESVQKEVGRAKGDLQSFVWLALAAGGILGNLTGGFALSEFNYHVCCVFYFGSRPSCGELTC